MNKVYLEPYIDQNVRNDLIDSWVKTQENGDILYTKYPEYNLATEGREVVEKFKKFCDFKGNVLDVGCGFQMPSYLKRNPLITLGIGIDPLVREKSDIVNIELMKSVGENMPFKDESFDCISFMTSFDHVIDPDTVLKETYRLLKKTGIAVFCVESENVKKSNICSRVIRKFFPKSMKIDNAIVEQEKIISSLEHPKGSADKFHLRHIKHIAFTSLACSMGFKKISEEYHPQFYSVFLKFSK